MTTLSKVKQSMHNRCKQWRKFALIIGGFIVMTHGVNAAEITVQVDNINTDKKGQILVMLYGEDGFPKAHDKAIFTHAIPVTTNSISVNFDVNVVPEQFAIKILHDEDNSGEVTKNWTGIIPAEGLGFSNGAKVSFGPPSFKKAQLTYSPNMPTITINVIYP